MGVFVPLDGCWLRDTQGRLYMSLCSRFTGFLKFIISFLDDAFALADGIMVWRLVHL